MTAAMQTGTPQTANSATRLDFESLTSNVRNAMPQEITFETMNARNVTERGCIGMKRAGDALGLEDIAELNAVGAVDLVDTGWTATDAKALAPIPIEVVADSAMGTALFIERRNADGAKGQEIIKCDV